MANILVNHICIYYFLKIHGLNFQVSVFPSLTIWPYNCDLTVEHLQWVNRRDMRWAHMKTVITCVSTHLTWPAAVSENRYMLNAWIHQSSEISKNILAPLAAVSPVWISWSILKFSESNITSISGVYVGTDWQPVQGGAGTGSSTPALQAAPNLGCMDGWRFHVMTSWCWCNI